MAHIQVDPNDDIKLYITKTKGDFQQVKLSWFICANWESSFGYPILMQFAFIIPHAFIAACTLRTIMYKLVSAN